MACTACHSAKRKCDRQSPCSRCVEKGLQCIPHVSRQGRKRSKPGGDDNDKHYNGLDRLLLEQVTTIQENRNHFGLKYLVRSWVSFAFKRRSFGLMQRACSLAMKVGFSMDEIFCEQPNSAAMDFLPPILLVPQALQETTSITPLQWTEIPERLLRTVNTLSTLGARENRWIWVREMIQGDSRYLVSKAFERDVSSWNALQKAWDENKGAVIDLFLLPEDKQKHTKSFAHQISLYKDSNAPEGGNRLTRTKVRLRTKNQGVVLVDQVSCLEIVNLDVAYFFLEYLHATPALQGIRGSTESLVAGKTADSEYFDLDSIDIEFDKELEKIFSLVRH